MKTIKKIALLVSFSAFFLCDKEQCSEFLIENTITIDLIMLKYTDGTVSNAVLEYRDYCDQFGITKPDANLRIIARSGSLMGNSAPMLRRLEGTPGLASTNQLRDFLVNMGINIANNEIGQMLDFAKPDILIRIKLSNHETHIVKSVVYHKLGHASHFKQVGSDYWVKYINYILTYGAYGDGTGVNAGHCEVGEMWGFYIEARLIKEYYAFNSYSLNSPSSGPWIFPQIFKSLEEDAGYSIQQIFSCLKPNIDTVPKLKNELINTIGLNVNIVNNIFSNHGY